MTKFDIEKSDPPRNGSGPWYAQIMRTILQTSGPVALIALALVWFLMWAVTAQIAAVRQSVEVNHTEIQAAKVTMHAFAQRQIDAEQRRELQLELQLRLLRQVCINSARTESATRACLDSR